MALTAPAGLGVLTAAAAGHPGRSGGSSGGNPGDERRATTSTRPDASRCASRGAAALELPAAKRRKVEDDDPCFRDSSNTGQLFLAAQTATVEWTIPDFLARRAQGSGLCLDGPTFGPRANWQVFCHPDGRCANLPQGGPCGVFIRYLGPHERVPAYATIEKMAHGFFRVPENNTRARESPFVVVFGRCEIEEWCVCKDFGLFDEDFCADLVNEALVLRARVTWIEPRADSLLPREVLPPDRLLHGDDRLSADLSALWAARRGPGSEGSTGGRAGNPRQVPPSDLVLVAEGQRFEADRVLLAARSQYFAAMLSFREASEREVPLSVPPRALAAVLCFAYTDEVPDLRSREEAVELLEAAAQLSFPGLQRHCSDYLRDNCLSVDNVLPLLRVADEHGASSLRAEALSLLAANFDAVKTTAAWEDLLQNGMNPMLIQDLLQAVQTASLWAGRASRS